MPIPPGPTYLARQLPHFLGPALATYLTLRIAKTHFNTHIPSWAWVILSLASRPVFFFLDRYTKPFWNARGAASLGATLPPRVEGNAFSILKEIIEGFLRDYPAEVVNRWTQKHGPVVTFTGLTQDAVCITPPSRRIMSELMIDTIVQVVTIVPEHVKVCDLPH